MSQTASDIVNARRIIEGPSDKLRAISKNKYPWAREYWRHMLNNTWTPAEVDLARDVAQYKGGELTEGEKQMYDRALAFLSNLDAIQLTNLAENVSAHITDPTIQSCIYRQVFEEALHVESYSTLVEAMCDDPLEIYDMYRVNPVLREKNDFVLAEANMMKVEGFTPEQFVYALVANVILEGVYFYSGFLAFYTLARMKKMLGSANMIKFIQRDEMVHLELFISMFNALREERPELFTEQVLENCRELFRKAQELESAWGRHIIEGGVLGLTDEIINEYVKYLADDRAQRLGLGSLYGSKNPVEWVDRFSRVNYTEENFFETKVTSYSKKQLDW
jgi:ribonucleoside-diphosphate reductase beta chain